MDTLITVIHVIVCIFLILVVLLQAGKGGGMGIAFGGAGGSTVFGGSGAGNFLTRLTVISAFLFMATSMTLAYIASSSGDDPLKALSAKSRAAAEERDSARSRILEGQDAPDLPDGVAPVDNLTDPLDDLTDPATDPATDPDPDPDPDPE